MSDAVQLNGERLESAGGPPKTEGPPVKKARLDGNLNNVDQKVLLAAQDHERWIAERRKNWPSANRVAEKLAKEQASAPKPEIAESSQPKKSVCRYFMRGTCHSGEKCRFSHERPAARPARPPHERIYKRFEAPPKTSLFLRLVQSDHDAEDERLLEFIEFLDSAHLIKQPSEPATESAPGPANAIANTTANTTANATANATAPELALASAHPSS